VLFGTRGLRRPVRVPSACSVLGRTRSSSGALLPGGEPEQASDEQVSTLRIRDKAAPPAGARARCGGADATPRHEAAWLRDSPESLDDDGPDARPVKDRVVAEVEADDIAAG